MSRTNNEIQELLPFICDDIHYDSKNIDSYNKVFNFVVSCREPGKSTTLWRKVYQAFRKEGRPSLVLRRQIVDITEQYINDISTLLHKFTGVYYNLKWNKQDIKQGMIDVKLNGKLFFRVIALSAPMSRLKSMIIENVKYMMMDEFICNLRLGEKYLKDEPMRVKEVFTTYNRESDGIKCYFFGNPYSLYNPYFSWLNVDTTKLKIGTITAQDKYAVEIYKMKDELKEFILKKNPLYEFDDSYKRYGFEGVAIQDMNIRLIQYQPIGFGLTYVFKLNGKILGVYTGFDKDLSLFYWCQMIDFKVSNRRDIVTFDFGEMQDGTVLCNTRYKKQMYYLKECIEHRQIAYKDIEASYAMEEIYQNL